MNQNIEINEHGQERNRYDLLFKLRNLARRWTPFVQPPQPSRHGGMGAIPQRDGTSFRVWAPNAQEVNVTGNFNNWSYDRHPLAQEGNGYWSATIGRAKPNDLYKFVLRNGQEVLRTDPYARRVEGHYRNGVIREPMPEWDDQFVTPALNELVIYELHTGTFDESAENPPGTFQGVIDKLPYLHKLGFNAIELMPVAEFNGELSWGYNPAHIFAIEEAYGGANNLRQLVKKAHALGIAVIIDVVYNHFGPEDLSLWQFDGWSENEKGGIYFYNDWRSKTPWADTRPDYGRPEVRQFIRDNVLMWFEEYHVDGLRWDATSYIRNAHGHDGDPEAALDEGWHMMQAISDEVHAKFPGKFLIAEDLKSNHAVTNSAENDGAGFDAQWDENFVHPLRDALITSEDGDRDMHAVAAALAYRYNDNAFQRVIYTESHDEVANGKARLPHEIAPELEDSAESYFAKKRATLGTALVFTAPGVPMVFQGQEFIENGWFRDDQKLDWQKARKHKGMLRLTRELVRLRRNLRGDVAGLTGQHVNVFHVNDDEKLLAFHRWQNGGAGDDVIVVANFANETRTNYQIGMPLAGTWRLRFNSDLSVYDDAFSDLHVGDVVAAVMDDDGLAASAEITVAPYSVLIFSQDHNPS